MKKHYYYSVLIALLVTLAGCTPGMDKLFKKQAPGVVLVLNRTYYEIKLSDGSTIYSPGLDEWGNPKFIEEDISDESLAEAESFVLTGTGFFVGKEGQILTNRHVVTPSEEELERIREAARQNLSEIKNMRYMMLEAYKEEYNRVEEVIQSYATYTYGVPMITRRLDEVEQLEAKQAELKKLIREAEEERRNSKGLTVESVHPITRIGVAYHDTYVTEEEDFLPCVIKRVSQDENVDLALITLKSKKTPKEAYVFDVPKGKGGFFSFLTGTPGKLKVSDPLYMIGYNHGVSLAATREGVAAQLTEGKVTQAPDGTRVLYSIAAMPGASGSPVLNRKGKLVAVNFASAQEDGGSFNFGIPLAAVQTFLYNDSNGAEENDSAASKTKEGREEDLIGKDKSAPNGEISLSDAKAVYRKLLAMLINGEFARLDEVLAPNLIQYGNLKNTTPADVSKQVSDYAKRWEDLSFDIEEFSRSASGENRFDAVGIYTCAKPDGSNPQTYRVTETIGFTWVGGTIMVNFRDSKSKRLY